MAKKHTEVSHVSTSTMQDMPEGFKVKRQITLPSLSIKKTGDAWTLKILDAMRVSKVVDKGADGKKREPATICTVSDVSNGELFTFIIPAVVKKNLQDNYPDDTYVDKIFFIKNMGKRNDAQKYYDFQLAEVEAE